MISAVVMPRPDAPLEVRGSRVPGRPGDGPLRADLAAQRVVKALIVP
ncbi:hypothetical protein [Nonomuraea lactucae]|nr:hypothetical protein [Nonomuraea lactucae]